MMAMLQGDKGTVNKTKTRTRTRTRFHGRTRSPQCNHDDGCDTDLVYPLPWNSVLLKLLRTVC